MLTRIKTNYIIRQKRVLHELFTKIKYTYNAQHNFNVSPSDIKLAKQKAANMQYARH